MSKKQIKKSVNYKVNDLVFARVRGYPPWPARITETGSKHKVLFFGTGETGVIKDEDLFVYEDNRESFKKKFGKRKYYQDSLNEITKWWNKRKTLDGITKDSPKVRIKIVKSDTNLSDKTDSVPVKESSELKNSEEKLPLEITVKMEPTTEVSKIEDNKTTKLVTKIKKEKKRSPNESLHSPPAKRVKPVIKSETLCPDDDEYMEDTTLRIPRDDKLYEAYTVTVLDKKVVKNDKLLKAKKELKLADCKFLQESSVVLLYEPLIYPVTFAMNLNLEKSEGFEGFAERLEWENKNIARVFDTIKQLKNKQKPPNLPDNLFMELRDYEQLLGMVKIIIERDDFEQDKRVVLIKEMYILKMVLAIRELIPVDVKEEINLHKAYALLKLIKSKHQLTYLITMKHPVVVECFWKLTKYVPNEELQGSEIVKNIRDISMDLSKVTQKHMKYEEGDEALFWSKYLKFMKSFRFAVASLSRFNFIAITSVEEYENLVRKEREIKLESQESNQTDEEIPANMLQL